MSDDILPVMNLDKILMDATVDELGHCHYEVEVRGIPPYDYRRLYTLKATTDTKAAHEGMRLFHNEVEALGPNTQ